MNSQEYNALLVRRGLQHSTINTHRINNIEFRVNENNIVTWSNNWAEIVDLPSEYFTHKHYGPSTYGHTDLVWTGKLEVNNE